MNKRLAKRWACTHSALVLKSVLDDGYPDEYGFVEEDLRRVRECIRDIVQELFNRGLLENDNIKYED